MLSVIFVLAATLTLLLRRSWSSSDRGVNKFALRWARSGEHGSPRFAAWGEATLAPAAGLRAACRDRSGRSGGSGVLIEDRHAVDQGRPVPVDQSCPRLQPRVQQAFRTRRHRAAPAGDEPGAGQSRNGHRKGGPGYRSGPCQPSSGPTARPWSRLVAKFDPSSPQMGPDHRSAESRTCLPGRSSAVP